jgi:hypothetical protein
MTAEPSEKPDLQAITGPLASPALEPDAHTEQEQKRNKKNASKPLPAERLEIHLRAQITETCQERDRLRNDHAQLQEQLNEALPEIKRTKEAYLNVLVANFLSAIFLGTGGILVSAASNHPKYTVQILWSGYAAFTCGVIVLALYTIFSTFRR